MCEKRFWLEGKKSEDPRTPDTVANLRGGGGLSHQSSRRKTLEILQG